MLLCAIVLRGAPGKWTWGLQLATPGMIVAAVNKAAAKTGSGREVLLPADPQLSQSKSLLFGGSEVVHIVSVCKVTLH